MCGITKHSWRCWWPRCAPDRCRGRDAGRARSNVTSRASPMCREKLAHRFDRIGFFRALVAAIAFDAREAQRDSAGILRTFLNFVQRNLDDQLGPYVYRACIARDFELEQLVRLPLQHRIGESFEGFSEHDELACARVASAEVQVGKPSMPAPVAPFGGKDDEIECVRLLDLEPAAATAACLVRRLQRFRHDPFMPPIERL